MACNGFVQRITSSKNNRVFLYRYLLVFLITLAFPTTSDSQGPIPSKLSSKELSIIFSHKNLNPKLSSALNQLSNAYKIHGKTASLFAKEQGLDLENGIIRV